MFERLLRNARGRGKAKEAYQEEPNWIINALERNVQTHSQWPVYRYLDEQGNVDDFITCESALCTARSVARFLREDCGLKQGDRVALVYPPGLEFVKAMWGCLFAGIVAVPLAPPNPLALKQALPPFNRILKDSGAVAILTDGDFNNWVRRGSEILAAATFQGKPGWPRLPWIETNAAAKVPKEHYDRARQEDQRLDTKRMDNFMPTEPPKDPDTVAYLQYTSGSTGDPKGVMVTHGNLYQHNEAGWNVFFHAEADARKQLGQDTQLEQDNSFITGTHLFLWLPHFHDFCLTVGILGCGMKGHPLVLMSPLHFMNNPTLWMDCMSRYKTTHTVGPDFSFAHVTKRSTPEQRKRWDLKNLQFIMSGAEPIRADTMDSFLSTFKECGLRDGVFCSAYGLAEHVCGATAWGTKVAKVDRRTLQAGQRVGATEISEHVRLLYSCGKPMMGVDLRIVDTETAEPCEPGHVGEIWLSSECVTAGYHNKPQLNQEVFKARLAGERGAASRYLRSGDMGFLQDGELYVTGRLKDMFILRGRNIYPNDVEDCVRAADHLLVRPGGIVAFAVDIAAPDGSTQADEEGLVVMVELPQKYKKKTPRPEALKQMIGVVKAEVLRHHRTACHAVVVARKGTVKKTSSGKVKRRDCAIAFMSGQYTERNPAVLRCEYAPVAPLLSNDLAMRKQSSPASSMRTSDSEQSSSTCVCMSESASDSASDGGRDAEMAACSQSSLTSSASSLQRESEGSSSHTAVPNVERLRSLPEEDQLEVLLAHMVWYASAASGIADLTGDDRVMELGFDSMRGAIFASQVVDFLGVHVKYEALLTYPTLRELAKHILHLLNTPEICPIGAMARKDTGVSLQRLAKAAHPKYAADEAPELLLSEADKGQGIPCSPAQQYFLALEQNAPNGADQNVVGALRLRGSLKEKALERALQSVMERHDALRTHFLRHADGSLHQVVQRPDEASVAFAYADAPELPQASLRPRSTFSEAVAENLPLPVLARLQREAGTPFELCQGPLVRALLVKLGSDDHLLLLVMHHAICDGFSFKVMLDDMSAAYDALKMNKMPSLPPVGIQYPDFARWQIANVQSAKVKAQVEYWKGKLSGVRSLQLPSDFIRKPVHGCSRGGWVDIVIPENVVRPLAAFAATSSVTMYMLLLSSLQLLLRAYSRHDDVVVGTPYAGRVDDATHPLQRTVGCCINTLPMRTRFEGMHTLGQLVQDVGATCRTAYDNADASLVTIMQALGCSTDKSLFSVEFNLLPAEAQSAVSVDGLNVESFEVGTGTATSDYYLVLGQAKEQIAGRLEYNAELFNHKTAQLMASKWQSILELYAKDNENMRLADITAHIGNQAIIGAAAVRSEE